MGLSTWKTIAKRSTVPVHWIHYTCFEIHPTERTIHPDTLNKSLDNILLLDIRRSHALAESSEQLPGASWHDPEKIEELAGALPQDRDIVLYCVRGGSVSNSVVDALQAKGLKACFIEGGIEGWKTAGSATEPRASSVHQHL